MTQNVREILVSVKSLLAGTAAFMAGNSLLGVVLPLRMAAADYPVALTAATTLAYAAFEHPAGWLILQMPAQRSQPRAARQRQVL